VVASGRGVVSAEGAAEVRLEAVAEPAPPLSVPPVEPRPLAPVAPVVSPSGRWMVPVGWAGVAAGAALVGVGVFAAVRASSLEDEFSSDRGLAAYRADVARGRDVCDVAEGGTASGATGSADPSTVREHCASLARMRTLGPIAFVGGGLLAASGAALLLLAPSSSRPSAPTTGVRWHVAPSVGPALAGGVLQGTW
jgi:hypothetical protein